MNKLICLLVLGVLCAPQAKAAALAVEPFADMINRAPTVVRGLVSQKFQRPGLGATTCHKIQVTETMKGKVAARITVCELGGPVGDGSTLGTEMAELVTGEDVVLLLDTQNADGTYPLYGSSGGKVSVDAKGVVRGDGPNIDRAHHGYSWKWTLDDVRASAQAVRD